MPCPCTVTPTPPCPHCGLILSPLLWSSKFVSMLKLRFTCSRLPSSGEDASGEPFFAVVYTWNPALTLFLPLQCTPYHARHAVSRHVQPFRRNVLRLRQLEFEGTSLCTGAHFVPNEAACDHCYRANDLGALLHLRQGHRSVLEEEVR